MNELIFLPTKLDRTLCFVLIATLAVLFACYEPEELIPPVYLESEASVVVDNIAWPRISEADVLVDFQSNYLSLGLKDSANTAWFTCAVFGKESALFTDYSEENDILPIKTGEYKTNDSIIVIMYYRTANDGGEITDPLETIYWYDDDPYFNIWTIEEAFIENGEWYISGSFTARMYHANSKQSPRYRYVDGTFKNARVSKTYYKAP